MVDSTSRRTAVRPAAVPSRCRWATVASISGMPRQARDVAVLTLRGVERQLGQQGQHAVDRVDEGVADGELDERYRGRARHVLRHAADEVERLQLDFGQPALVELSRRFGQCGQPFALRLLGSLEKSGSRSS